MFKNRVRLPVYVKEPQFPTEANRFRLSNGSSKTLSVVIRKQYTLQTDYLSESLHQKLVIALNHDEVNIENDKYLGGVSVDGEYEISWPTFLDYPLGQATVKLQVTPFDMTNANCQTCEEASQLSLVDDEAGEIDEGTPAEVGVYGNDTICCFPIVAEITWFDTGYLASATINQANGVVTLTTHNPVPPVGNIKLATYRITCPDGSYDEADIYGSINGSGEACEQPGGFEEVVFDAGPPITATITWTTPVVFPASFEWRLERVDTPGVAVDTGIEFDYDAFLNPLEPLTEYAFFVRSNCGGGIYSPYTQLLFTTPATGGGNCGRFDITANTMELDLWDYSYMDCNGNIQNATIASLATQQVCMLTDDDNNPIYFEGDEPVAYNYVEPC